ncbi:MAG TPA: beta-galactosidase [Candidatus Lokiarchaeia archaeon]|nr:beta-galactosidase [Candidatus Lokiarchaeia archaeon]
MTMKQPNLPKYNKEKYGNIIDWDKYSLKINGNRVFLIGGEFHYWRVPDKERWADILKTYKAAGLTCMRIYFHWGYHSPAEGKYVFDGNRDVDYLLTLCEEIGLYVFVASGPYICAETQAGGYPLWMLQKRDVRIKHMKGNLTQKYDETYMKYCKDWFEHFIPNVKKHQLTENSSGCVIGYQIENEYLESAVVVKGQKRYMIELMKIVRDCGITVPIFHNDALDRGSWNWLVDMYGFDKYPAFANKKARTLNRDGWSIKSFTHAVDGLEKRVRNFGPCASETPMFIPELQGGWFNHWTVKYGFDDLYDYYGPTYQKMLVESCAAQDVTIMDLYMFYGGTNQGAIGNPEVYTSYDYSACLREYGYQSDRLKELRMFLLFTKSFMPSIAETTLVPAPDITCSTEGVLNLERKATDGTCFYFFRNFNMANQDKFSIHLADGTRVPREKDQFFKPRDAFVAVGNLAVDGFKIKFCSMPILVKGKAPGGTLLVVEKNEAEQNGGELLIEGNQFSVSGTMKSDVDNGFSRIWFEDEGIASVVTPDDKVLDIICLSRTSARTCNADFSGESVKIAWGTHACYFTRDGKLEVQAEGKERLYLLAYEPAEIPGFMSFKDSDVTTLHYDKEFAWPHGLDTCLKYADVGEDEPDVDLEALQWSRIKLDLANANDAAAWKPIDIKTQNDPIDHGFMSGHVIYKCEFNPGNTKAMSLALNIRHKAAVWLNGKFVGSQKNYTVTLLISLTSPGGINGPDPLFMGTKKYDLAPALKPGETNQLVVITESLGQNKQFFPINDVRQPRGILSAKFSKTPIKSQWFISGEDVTTLENPYSTSGLPGERLGFHEGNGEGWDKITELSVQPSDQLAWFKTTFPWNVAEDTWIPLRLHLEGMHNANIFLNGHYIGRYWGEAGPQHDFYLMDKFLQAENTLVLACWTTTDDTFKAELLPYMINPSSGNIDPAGAIAATKKYLFDL